MEKDDQTIRVASTSRDFQFKYFRAGNMEVDLNGRDFKWNQEFIRSIPKKYDPGSERH